ncbi:hypothetical protein Tco_1290949 [Tanacetum coccineum]
MPTVTTGRCLIVAVTQQRKRNAAAAVELLHTPNDLVSRNGVSRTIAVRGTDVSTRYEVAVTSVRGVYGSVPIIGNHEAVGGVQKDYNTPRSSNMSGGVLERMRLPLPLGAYIKSTHQLL